MCSVAQNLIGQGIEQGIKQGIDQGIKQGINQGIKQGINQGGRQMIYKLVSEGDLSIEKGAKNLNITIEQLQKDMMVCGYNLHS